VSNEDKLTAGGKYSLDLSQAAIFCIVFLAVGGLVALGKVDAKMLEYLLFILIPSPVKRETPPAGAQ
jgi:hypothetical protein